jgi:enoyl-CoA hydratase/carnithine racemase
MPSMIERERDGQLLVFRIKRPERRNALDMETLGQLAEHVRGASTDRSLRAIVLTGSDGAFASGADLGDLRTMRTEEEAVRFLELGRSITFGFAFLDVPVIAAVNGLAFGGGAELAFACDLRVAELRARFCFKHARLGLCPAWGTTARLLSLTGASRALRLLYTANELSASEAAAHGLVDNVVANDQSVAAALAWAYDIAQGARGSVAAMKATMRAAVQAFEAAHAEERARFLELWASPDHEEALTAYFERRAPRWAP